MAFYTSDFYANQRLGSLNSAQIILPDILRLISPSSVVDVGCGIGTWLAAFKYFGITEILGIDGAHVDQDSLLIEKNEFLAHNLVEAIELDRKFDLALSLEVAEHLPEESANRYIEALTQLAPVVLFSAAIPNQTGEGHINEQWPDYWAEKFKCRGYRVLDCLRGKYWNEAGIATWYKQNLMIFVQEANLQNYPALLEAAEDCSLRPLSIVHPDYYDQRTRMALFQPWRSLYLYYHDALVELVKRILPRSIVIKLKKIKHSLRQWAMR